MRQLIVISFLTVFALTSVGNAQEIWVDISNFAFTPSELWIDEGTTVIWTNFDQVNHTVTSNTNLFNSGVLTLGQDFSYTFNAMGLYEYYCEIHPAMVGEIHVMNAAGMDIELDLQPTSVPVIIPSNGGSFEINATVINEMMMPWTLQYWAKVYLPNGNPVNVAGPFNFTSPANSTRSATLQQLVPANAPAGTYTYFGYIGTQPDFVRGFSMFQFSKSAADGANPDAWSAEVLQDWNVTSSSTGVKTAAKLQIVNSPEPFNPTTEINFNLPSAGTVHLEVFNVRGANVATLVNGYREAGNHQVTFDASALPSGVYLYRLTALGETVTGKMFLLK